MSIVYIARAEQGGMIQMYIGKTNRTLEVRRKEHEKNSVYDAENFYSKLKEIPFAEWHWEPIECQPEEVNALEQKLIKAFQNIPGINLLNKSHNTTRTEKNDFGISKTSKQINFSPGELGKKFAQKAGTLKPVINLKTQKKYSSILEATRVDDVSRSSIKNSCNTGKMLKDGTRYAYLDLEGNPLFTAGHAQEVFIGVSAKKVKELVSGKIYKNTTEAAEAYNLSRSSIAGFASGKYGVAKEQYAFCYLDNAGAEIITAKHAQALETIKNKNKVKYVAWPVNLSFEEAQLQKQVGYYKTLDEICEELKITNNKGHIKAVCEGIRSHIKTFRIAFYDNAKSAPILTEKHLIGSQKVIRQVLCINDEKIFKNCSKAGKHYNVSPNQIRLCANGTLKSVRVKNDKTGEAERMRFVHLDAGNNPIETMTHRQDLSQRKGTPRILLLNQKTVNLLGKDIFNSLAEFCRETGVPPKRAKKYLTNPEIDLLGYEFKQI